jgi:hypothetical protein
MKTKVSQKEWNDKRDAFLCAIVTALAGVEGGWNITWAITEAATLTSELYEVEEEKPVQQYEKAMFMGQEFDNLSRPIKAEEPINHRRMSKQTAVEWLIKQVQNRQNGVIKDLPVLSLDQIFEQAKAMEKEQHYESYRVGNCFTNSDLLRFEDFFAEYYNQTYGGTND